jgi:hypothetical protein
VSRGRSSKQQVDNASRTAGVGYALRTWSSLRRARNSAFLAGGRTDVSNRFLNDTISYHMDHSPPFQFHAWASPEDEIKANDIHINNVVRQLGFPTKCRKYT